MLRDKKGLLIIAATASMALAGYGGAVMAADEVVEEVVVEEVEEVVTEEVETTVETTEE